MAIPAATNKRTGNNIIINANNNLEIRIDKECFG